MSVLAHEMALSPQSRGRWTTKPLEDKCLYKKNLSKVLVLAKKNPQNRHNFSGPMLSPRQPFKKGFLLTMTRQSYGASGVEVHVGRAHGWSVFTRFQTHIGRTQAPKPQRVLGFDPLPFLGSRIWTPQPKLGLNFQPPLGEPKPPTQSLVWGSKR